MSKFENQVFFTTLRITIPSSDGKSSSIGTGFLFNMPLRQEGMVGHFLVSNKHVFGDPHRTIILNFHKLKNGVDEPDLGQVLPIVIQNFSEHYYSHPDDKIDLACINVSAFAGPSHGVYSKHLHCEFTEEIDLTKLLPGTEVSFVGYPDNRFDTAHNLPILRKGYLATLPSVDFNGLKQVLIDAQVFPGSSGSPVFVVVAGKYRLLGVVTQTMIKNAELTTMPVEYSLGVKQTIGLGIVLKTELVMQLLQVAKDGLSNRVDSSTATQP
ncbi:hypothetical protein [Desulfobacula sp.]|uniref:trypsin-like peptidase domain-containing protein n=1 Tax=Desulfobacula sp. TaxID=2593537 RepID=UPI002618E01F|nr:hypothetical protein [Desulfobacula sp.]